MTLLHRVISAVGHRLGYTVRSQHLPSRRIHLLPGGMESIDFWKRVISEVRHRFRWARRGPGDPLFRIHLLPRGMELIDLWERKPRWQLAWNDVKEIIAFKRDLYIVDSICIAFRTTDELHYFQVAEEDENWNDLCDTLQSEFGINWPDCYTHIVQPPFAPNRTTIWGTPWPLPCPNCDYDLRGSPTLCPECGRPVDPPSLLPPANR